MALHGSKHRGQKYDMVGMEVLGLDGFGIGWNGFGIG